MADEFTGILSLTFEEIIKMNEGDLANLANFKYVKNAILNDSYYSYEFSHNFELDRYLEKIVSQPSFSGDQKLIEEYQKLIKYLYYLRIPVLPVQEIFKIVKEELTNILLSDVDLNERIDSHIKLSFLDDITGPTFINNLLRALKTNQQLIGNKSIVINNKEYKPIIANWLNDYDNFFKSGNQRSALDRINYLNNSSNVKKLTLENKGLLTKILEFYDSFRHPEESSARGDKKVIPKNILSQEPSAQILDFNKIKKRSVTKKIEFKKFSPEEINKLYQGNLEENKKIKARAGQLAESIGADFKKIQDNFYLLLQGRSPDKIEVIAYLNLLAQQEKLDNLLKEDIRFYNMVKQDIIAGGEQESLNDFKMYPAAPQFIRLFLEIILQKKLRLKENEAARFALYLGNLLKQAGNDKYTKLAYFDMAVGEFRWKK